MQEKEIRKQKRENERLLLENKKLRKENVEYRKITPVTQAKTSHVTASTCSGMSSVGILARNWDAIAKEAHATNNNRNARIKAPPTIFCVRGLRSLSVRSPRVHARSQACARMPSTNTNFALLFPVVPPGLLELTELGSTSYSKSRS